MEKQGTVQKANIHSGKPVEIAVIDKAAASLRQLSTV